MDTKDMFLTTPAPTETSAFQSPQLLSTVPVLSEVLVIKSLEPFVNLEFKKIATERCLRLSFSIDMGMLQSMFRLVGHWDDKKKVQVLRPRPWPWLNLKCQLRPTCPREPCLVMLGGEQAVKWCSVELIHVPAHEEKLWLHFWLELLLSGDADYSLAALFPTEPHEEILYCHTREFVGGCNHWLVFVRILSLFPLELLEASTTLQCKRSTKCSARVANGHNYVACYYLKSSK